MLMGGCVFKAGNRGEAGAASPRAEAAFVSDVSSAAKLWTHTAFHNDPNMFRFAIISDRTGGARAGVFEKAIRSLNRLQPEFVVSVGDLIPGYTTNLVLLAKQWREIESLVARLEMPFFYTLGNHDLSYPVAVDFWAEKHSRPYYHFVYKNVLFLVLDSQDGGIFVDPDTQEIKIRSGISAAQAQYFAGVLEKYRNVAWTFVLMHEPLWLEEEGNPADPAHPPMDLGFKNIQDLLEGRRYTVFTGHTHGYEAYERRNAHYYVLATTGGGSKLRGPEYGEFDEVAWVAMTPEGPRLSNLALDGILDADVYTEIEEQERGAVLTTCPALTNLVVDLAGLRTSGSTELVMALTNAISMEMEVHCEWICPNQQWSVTPALSSLVLQAGESGALRWHVRCLANAGDLNAVLPVPQAEMSVKAGNKVVFRNHVPLLSAP